jgi:glycosyltransferase involved in cell wall biosynthesis
MLNKLRNIIDDYLQMHRLKTNIKSYEILRKVDLSDENKKRFNQVTPRRKKKKLSIAFIIPGMPRYSGGHTSILRLGTYLSDFGHEVFYISYLPQKISEMVSNAKHNLESYKGEILGPEGLTELNYDVGVATYWVSAYYLWNMDNVKYKAYFIQDYEPDFYPKGDISIFVENTYRMNYHMVSLGPWNKNQIEEKFRVPVDEIVFPFEPKEYWAENNWKQKFTRKRNIKITVYLKNAEKRGPILLLMSLEELYKVAKSKGYEVEVLFFGNNRRIKYPISVPYKNLGKPPKDELRKLYQKSDFGVVFSYTNISLVPLEMMACGCPVIEVYEGSFGSFFNSSCAILVNSYPQDFVKKVMWYIEHPEERLKIAENAMNSLQKRSWEEAARQFNQILLKGYNK